MSDFKWNTGIPEQNGWYLVCQFNGESHYRFSREYIVGYGWVNAKEDKYGKVIRWGELPPLPALEDRDMNISMIVAMGKNGVIGLNGVMPWHCRNELRHFKERTFGKTVVAGRKTADILNSLPYRNCFYLSRNPESRQLDNGFNPITLHEVLGRSVKEEVMIIGGREIYDLFMPYAKRLLVSYMMIDREGDTKFSEIPNSFAITEFFVSPEREFIFTEYTRKDVL